MCTDEDYKKKISSMVPFYGMSSRLQIQVIWRSKKFFYLVESCSSGKRLSIVLKHKPSSKCAINAGTPQNFLSNILCFKWAKED